MQSLHTKKYSPLLILYAEGLHTYPLFAYKNPILNNFCAQNVCKSMQKYSWFAYILHTCLHTTHQSSKPLGSFAADAAHSTVRHSREAETSDVLKWDIGGGGGLTGGGGGVIYWRYTLTIK